MTTKEKLIAKAAYDCLLERASKLSFIDKMVLMNALNNQSDFSAIPAAQQHYFLDVAMSVIKALKAANGQP
jgi:hypothetical protein